jgi:hypothetical protein
MSELNWHSEVVWKWWWNCRLCKIERNSLPAEELSDSHEDSTAWCWLRSNFPSEQYSWSHEWVSHTSCTGHYSWRLVSLLSSDLSMKAFLNWGQLFPTFHRRRKKKMSLRGCHHRLFLRKKSWNYRIYQNILHKFYKLYKFSEMLYIFRKLKIKLFSF